MIRLVKMELYRLFHAISTYVMIAVLAGIAVLMTFLLKVDLNMVERSYKAAGNGWAEQNAEENLSRTEGETPAESFADGFADGFMSSERGNAKEDEFTFGITATVDETWLGGDIDAGDVLMSELNSCLMFLFISVFVPLFVNAEQKKGYMKNIAGQIPGREMLALSKMPAVAVQAGVLLAAFCTAHLAASAIFFRERIVLTNTGALIGALGMQYVLHAAWGCLIALLTMASRSTAFAMTTGILLSSGIFELLARYLNRMIYAIIPSAESFDIMRITLTYAAGGMNTESTMRQIGGFAVIAAVHIIISAVVAGMVYRKRDVR